jgi:DNA-binding transcriptional regulator YiaG
MDHAGVTNQRTNLQTIRQKETNSKKMRVYDHIIQQLVVRRNELGISQRTLDYEIGCADGLVGKWERKKRRPSAFMLSCWVEALNCEIIIKSKQ